MASFVYSAVKKHDPFQSFYFLAYLSHVMFQITKQILMLGKVNPSKKVSKPLVASVQDVFWQVRDESLCSFAVFFAF